MQGVFISYRRQDSQSAAGRLADDIKELIVDVPVFRDVETIAPGVDFVDAINRALQSCGVLLAVIGPRWLTAADSAGQRRLDNPDDYTRLEIATALKRNDVRVIPVLVEGALMPSPGELPADLQALARRNAVELSDNRWNYDVSRLAATVGEALGVALATPGTRSHQRRWLIMAAVALAAVGMGYLGWRGQAPVSPELSTAQPAAAPTQPAAATSPIKNVSEAPINPPPDASSPAQIPPNTAQLDPCPVRLSINRSLPTPFSCRCDASSLLEGGVWGSDVYTDDSSVCRAAVHVGVIPPTGGPVTVIREVGRPLYVGSRRNGIESSDYGAYSDSIRFVGAPPSAPGLQPCPVRLSINRSLPNPFSCLCSATSPQHGSVWGSDVYTDDSHLCLAAVHFGVISTSGGTVTVTREAGRPLYTGSFRNGVQSSDYGAYSDSIRFVRRTGGGQLTVHPDAVLRALPDKLRIQPR